MMWTYQCIDKPAAEPSKITTMIEYFVITTLTQSLIINDDLEPECAVYMETEKMFSETTFFYDEKCVKVAE